MQKIIKKIHQIKDNFKLFLPFFRYLSPYRRRLIFITALGYASILTSLAMTYLSKSIVDKGIVGRSFSVFIKTGLIGAVFFIINNALTIPKSLLEMSVRLKIGFDLKKDVFRRIEKVSLLSFQNKSSSDYLFKITHDLEDILSIITTFPTEVLSIVFNLLFVMVMIIYLDWQMAVFSIAINISGYLSISFLNRQIRRAEELFIGSSQNIFAQTGEFFSHIYLVKALKKERDEINKYLKGVIKNLRIQVNKWRLGISRNLAGSILSSLLLGAITLFGSFQVMRGRISAGTLTAMFLYLGQFNNLQGRSLDLLRRIQLSSINCERITKLIFENTEPGGNKFDKRVFFHQANLEFKGVSFGFSPGEYVIRNLTFNMGTGLVALAGPSGCGKTTVLNLILDLYKPWQGEIHIVDGYLGEMDRLFFKEQVGVSLQEPFLWNDSIENNIRYAKPQATKQEIIKAANIAGVSDFIDDTPQGYDTVVGENACRLSDGQKQKIAIARAIIRKPKILILDEAMSSMDSASEEKIINGIKELLPGSLIIIVSHRLSSVAACDLVYFLKGPDKMVIGKPAELIKDDQDFYNLFSAQIIHHLAP